QVGRHPFFPIQILKEPSRAPTLVDQRLVVIRIRFTICTVRTPRSKPSLTANCSLRHLHNFCLCLATDSWKIRLAEACSQSCSIIGEGKLRTAVKKGTCNERNDQSNRAENRDRRRQGAPGCRNRYFIFE